MPELRASLDLCSVESLHRILQTFWRQGDVFRKGLCSCGALLALLLAHCVSLGMLADLSGLLSPCVCNGDRGGSEAIAGGGEFLR